MASAATSGLEVQELHLSFLWLDACLRATVLSANLPSTLRHGGSPVTTSTSCGGATIEQEIAAAVNGKYNGGPIISLVSGERLVVREVLLYDVNKVAEINSLKAQAGEKLQGFTTGLGFWGSPGWVIGGALALGAVEGIISNAKQKTGLQLLTLAAESSINCLTIQSSSPSTAFEGCRRPIRRIGRL